MANLSDVSIGNNNIQLLVFLDAGMVASNYYIYITNNNTGQKSPDLGFGSGTASNSYNFTGLTAGTTYTFSATVTKVSDSSSVFVPNRSFTTTGTAPQAEGYISDLNRYDKSLQLLFMVPYGETAYSHYIYIKCDQTGEESPDLGYTYDSNNPHYSMPYTFTGLQPNTTYSFTARVQRSNGTSYYSYRSFTTLAPMRPSNFEWTYPKVSGGDFKLTAAEWNAFMNKVNDFREYKSRNRSSYTTAYTGNTFYASQFNEAVNMISVMNGNTPVPVFPDESIYASEINRLRDSINEIT